MIQVTPVILCGGSGTRLWPLSRTGFPKQFLCLTGHESLFQQAAQRLADGIAQLLRREKAFAYRYEGTRYDCGSKLGFCRPRWTWACNMQKWAANSRIGCKADSWAGARAIQQQPLGCFVAYKSRKMVCGVV